MSSRSVQKNGAARNILVIKLGALGDIIQNEGAFHDIRAHHPEARITALTTQRHKAIFDRCPWFDAVIVDPRASWFRVDSLLKLLRALRQPGFDLVYDLQNNRRTRFYRHWLHVRWTGYVSRVAKKAAASAVEGAAAQLMAAGLNPRHTPHPDLGWMAADVSGLLKRHGIEGGFTLLIPGSSARHPKKRWPHYFELAARLVADGEHVVTAPGPDEITLCEGLPGIALLDDERPLDIFQLVGLSRHAGFVIGNDTGPTHLAAHAGAPGLALFGPHMRASATYIDRRFAVIEVPDLHALSVADVYDAYKRERAKAASATV